MKEFFVPSSRPSPPPPFSVHGTRMQENFFQRFWNRNIMVYYY